MWGTFSKRISFRRPHHSDLCARLVIARFVIWLDQTDLKWPQLQSTTTRSSGHQCIASGGGTAIMNLAMYGRWRPHRESQSGCYCVRAPRRMQRQSCRFHLWIAHTRIIKAPYTYEDPPLQLIVDLNKLFVCLCLKSEIAKLHLLADC